jgi:hypothetical protein
MMVMSLSLDERKDGNRESDTKGIAGRGVSELAGPRFLITFVNGDGNQPGKPMQSVCIRAPPEYRITTYVTLLGSSRKVTFADPPPKQPVKMGSTLSIHPTRLMIETEKNVMFHIQKLHVSYMYRKSFDGTRPRIMCMYWPQTPQEHVIEARLTGHSHKTKSLAYNKKTRDTALNNERLELILSKSIEHPGVESRLTI